MVMGLLIGTATALILSLIYFIVLLFKNDHTHKLHINVCYAVCKYRLDCVHNDIEPLVHYTDMQSYDKTLYRVWDWGYKRILPEDKFALIKPYL